MSGFFFSSSIPALQEPGLGENAVKKTPRTSTEDFGTFLDVCFKDAGLFAVPAPFPVTKSCSASFGNTASTPLPCPLSTQSAVSLSCQDEVPLGVEGTQDPLGEFSTLLSDALEMVENFTVTLRLGEGKVTVSGARNEDGVFSFTLEGKKEDLVEFFTLLFENLRTWIEGKGEEKPQCTKLQCGKISQEDGQSEETVVPTVDVVDIPLGEHAGEPEVVLGSPSPLPGEGELPTQDALQAAEVETEPLVQDASFEGEASREILRASERKHPGLLKRAGFAPSAEEVTASSPGEEVLTQISGVEKDRAEDSPTSSGEGMVSSFASAKNVERAATQDVKVSVASPEDFVKVFEEVLRVASETRGRKEVVLHLEPEHLGSIIIRLEERGGQIHCFWEVADPGTRELLARYLPALEAHFNAQGMPFTNFFGDGQNAYTFSNFRWAWVLGKEDVDETPFEDSGVFRVNLLA